jgi:DNA-binding protein YbaB
MFQKLKQYKDLRDSAKEAQSVLSKETVHADSVGGKIGVVMDGNQQILSIDIDPSLLARKRLRKALKKRSKEQSRNSSASCSKRCSPVS